MISKQQRQQLQRRLHALYGNSAPDLVRRFELLIGRYGVGLEEESGGELWDHRTSVLITYADTLHRDGEVPLKSLADFSRRRLKGVVSTLHLLPFFPWSSDDGFSVIDYRKVESANGDWSDIRDLGESFDLMFDLVLNHCSRRSAWFRDFVTGIAPARWYFLPINPKTDLSAVVRPRPWPLLTKTATRDGPAHVWTTFSEDQVDLNWQNPDVLFEFLDILFLYLSMGCRIFRLDAVAFLWKTIGTNCLHLPETHEVVKLFRDVLEIVAPRAILLTETNVPHEENISYFGDGDEAHMVYNFSLPPLILYGTLKGSAELLTEWASQLPDLSPEQSFFNFTASHDGIGVRPLQGLVSDEEIAWLADEVKVRGGRVSMKANGDGTESPYELNITYRSAMAVPGDLELGLRRFLMSQALVLGFKGVPAIYIHSLLGTENALDFLEETGQNRSINRAKLELDAVDAFLEETDDPRSRIYRRLCAWIRIRNQHVAFHPGAGFTVLRLDPAVFAFIRTSRTAAESIACLHNFGSEPKRFPLEVIFEGLQPEERIRELLGSITLARGEAFRLEPYHAAWLQRVVREE
jgi:glycosidase